MRDADVRRTLVGELQTWHAEPDTLFVDELDLGGLVRVDMAAVNGALWGYEIKSARDTLRRLPKQVEIYSLVLDHAALVVAESHLKHAEALVPDWWEVLLVREDEGCLAIEQTRAGRRNPAVDPMSLAQLLWRDEALGELADRSLDHGVRSKPRRAIWQRLAAELELAELRSVVRTRLKTRQAWRGTCSPA